MPQERSKGARITNQDIYYMLGELKATQAQLLEMLKQHFDDDQKHFHGLYAKTDKLSNILTYATGAVSIITVGAAFIGHKYLGI